MKTTELEKLMQIKDQSEICGQFLDWLLIRYAMFDRSKSRETPFEDVMGAGDYINKEKLLAAFFDIDLDKVEEEKQYLINQLRNDV